MAFDCRLLRHRRRIGRRARGARRRRPWREGCRRRGIPRRRHLRHPRLRAEEAAGLRQPLRRRFRATRRDSAGASATPRFDWPTLVAAKERKSRASPAPIAPISTRPARLIEERATVVGPHTRAAGRRARRSRAPPYPRRDRRSPARRPAIPGLELAITSNEIFDLRVFPRRLLVVGGGYIAVEFASLFRAARRRGDAGHARRQLLRGFDEDMREGMRDATGERRRRASLRPPADGIESGPTGRCSVTLSDGAVSSSIRLWSRPGGGPTPRASASRRPASSSTRPGAVVVDDHLTTQRALDPRGRRRHQPHQPDPGRDPRGPGARRPVVRRRRRRSATTRRERGLRHAGDRRGRH